VSAELLQQYHKLLEMQEDLHPELQRHYSEDDFPMLRHPLVYSVPHTPHLNAWANSAFESKKKIAERAVRDKDWSDYLIIHERPYRLDALMEIMHLIEHDCEYWEQVGFVYTDSENIRQNVAEWNAVLSSERGDREHIMNEADREHLAELSENEVVTIYRGCNSLDLSGFSWTLDRKIAEWFAKRHREIYDMKEVVIKTGQVETADIIAYFTNRGEEEILVHPHKVMNVKKEAV